MVLSVYTQSNSMSFCVGAAAAYSLLGMMSTLYHDPLSTTSHPLEWLRPDVFRSFDRNSRKGAILPLRHQHSRLLLRSLEAAISKLDQSQLVLFALDFDSCSRRRFLSSPSHHSESASTWTSSWPCPLVSPLPVWRWCCGARGSGWWMCTAWTRGG